MAKRKKQKRKTGKPKLSDDSKLFAFLAVFLSIIGFIIALLAKKDDKYVMYYAKQSLVIFIVWAIISVASWALIFFPLKDLIIGIAWILVFIVWIITWINALQGKMKPAPVIGLYGEKIDL